MDSFGCVIIIFYDGCWPKKNEYIVFVRRIKIEKQSSLAPCYLGVTSATETWQRSLKK